MGEGEEDLAKRKWLVYSCVAAIAAAVYNATGHNSIVFNAIGFSSPVVMLAGFIIHIYEGTAAAPGTFQSMTNGTVTEDWAWTHHPAWYGDVTGRDPRQDYEQARDREADRSDSQV